MDNFSLYLIESIYKITNTENNLFLSQNISEVFSE